MKIILLRSGPSTILAAAFQSRFVAMNEPLLLVALGSEGSQPEIAAGSKNCWPVLPADANGVDHGTGLPKAEISGLRLLHSHWCEDAGAASIASEWLRSGARFACGSGKRTTTFTALAGPSSGSHRRGISVDQRSIDSHVIDARNQHWLLC